MAIIPKLEVLEKGTSEISEIPVKDFLNPKGTKSEWVIETELAPKTFNQSYTMLLDMLSGETFQNQNFGVRLKGAQHRWDW